MTKLHWTLLFAALTLFACGGDTPAGEGAGTDTGADVADDVATDAVDADAQDDDAEADTLSPDADAGEADVTPDPCPGSILCLDEVSGNPSRRVCLDNGFPEGTTCERQGDVACCVAPFACETNEDCEEARGDEDFCADTRYPCLCDVPTGGCFTGVCSADAECDADERCLDGICSEAPATDGLIARILTQPTVAASGERVSLVAVAVDPNDPSRVDAFAPITWEVVTADVDASFVEPGQLNVGEGAGPLVVRARVTANDSDEGDTLELTRVGASDVPEVWVWDEHTREPLEGVTVVVNGVVTVTSSEGRATGWEDEAPYDVHVFGEGYTYVSLFGAEEQSLFVPLARHTRARIAKQEEGDECVADDEDLQARADTPESCGGTTGRACLCYQLEGVDVVRGAQNFDLTPSFGDTKVALSGVALGNSLLDLNFDLILGPEVVRDLGVLADDVSVPSGVTLEFNGEALVDSYVATAPAGDRLVWTVGGRVTLTAILPDILGQIGGDLQIGPIIALVLPFFDDFYSGVAPPLTMDPEGTFPVRDPELTLRVPTQRRTEVAMPTLPELPRGWTDTAIVLGGVLVPGQGFVPTGLSGGADATDGEVADGAIDGDLDEPGVQPLPLSMAPMHGPILSSGSRYMVAAVALMLDDGFDGAPASATSGVIRTYEAGSALPSDVTFEQDAFLPFALDAAWSEEERTLSLGDGSADLYRVVFEGERARRWVVYAPSGTTSLTLPAPTDALDFIDHSARGDVTVVGVTLRELSYDAILRADSRNLGDLFAVISGFSILGI